VTVGTPAPGFITFVWAADVNGISINDGILCKLHFTSTTNEGSPLEFVNTPTQLEFSDFEGTLFEPQAINGAIKSTTGIGEAEQSMLMIYPNPVSGQGNLTYTIPSENRVTITILNLLGQEVKTILNMPDQKAGTHSFTFNVDGLAPGIYYCKLSANNRTVVKKLIINE
jgi:hypothetical protein